MLDAFVCIALLIDYRLYRLIKSRLISVYFDRVVSEYEEELFPDALDSDFDTGCRTAPQEFVSDIKENRLNSDGPIDPNDNTHASYTGYK